MFCVGKKKYNNLQYEIIKLKNTISHLENQIFIKQNIINCNDIMVSLDKVINDNIKLQNKINILLKENRTYSNKIDDFNCVLCLTNVKSIMAFPCNHVVYCKECANNVYNKNSLNDNLLYKCPICRKTIEKLYYIYIW